MICLRVGLARVSTQKKAQDTSIAAQEKALLQAGCDKVITVRESGFKGPRRGWHELRKLGQRLRHGGFRMTNPDYAGWH